MSNGIEFCTTGHGANRSSRMVEIYEFNIRGRIGQNKK
ncbi:hypothetical protein BUH_4446 [Burkholderia pseudomallei Pakistan 9]|nr:hypothetical protein BUH_4446 [Burkholderia pseudomallei Pakistan 9]